MVMLLVVEDCFGDAIGVSLGTTEGGVVVGGRNLLILAWIIRREVYNFSLTLHERLTTLINELGSKIFNLL